MTNYGKSDILWTPRDARVSYYTLTTKIRYEQGYIKNKNFNIRGVRYYP